MSKYQSDEKEKKAKKEQKEFMKIVEQEEEEETRREESEEEKESEKGNQLIYSKVELPNEKEEEREENKEEKKELKLDKGVNGVCYFSEREAVEIKQSKETPNRKSRDPTLIHSTESNMQRSLGFGDLNDEEETNFVGQGSHRSRIKDISTESESDDDDMMVSHFDNSYLENKNEQKGGKSKEEKKEEKKPAEKVKVNKRSALDLTINKNINKSLKQTTNFRQNLKPQAKGKESDQEKELLATEQVKTNEIPNFSSMSINTNLRNKTNSSANTMRVDPTNHLTHSSLKPNSPKSHRTSPNENKPKFQPKGDKQPKHNFTSIENNVQPISFGNQLNPENKPQLLTKMKKNLGGHIPKFDGEIPENEEKKESKDDTQITEPPTRKLSHFGRGIKQKSKSPKAHI